MDKHLTDDERTAIRRRWSRMQSLMFRLQIESSHDEHADADLLELAHHVDRWLIERGVREEAGNGG